MFPHRYFAASYFAPTYWPPAAAPVSRNAQGVVGINDRNEGVAGRPPNT